jgi:dihydrodiol dehydrogenase / D-xylose 1-dehydrogenase (NADP)
MKKHQTTDYNRQRINYKRRMNTNMEKIKWGILGAGHIAGKFANAMASVEGAELYAVASRTLPKAQSFKDEFNAQKAYGSYAELVQDKLVDAIYIATPHSEHRDNAILCINAGKNILCEKPLVINTKQAEEIISLAKEKGVFLMEAMWTKFLPAVKKAMSWIKEGKIGEVRMINAQACFKRDFDPQNRLFNPALAGGALLDLGVYPITLASMVCGTNPSEFKGFAHIGTSGVDEQGTALLKYGTGEIASLSFALNTPATQDAYIYGSEGYIYLPHFWSTENAELWIDGTLIEKFHQDFAVNGYEYEIVEVDDCLNKGKKESDIATLADTLAVTKIMDKLRADFGEKYPFE